MNFDQDYHTNIVQPYAKQAFWRQEAIAVISQVITEAHLGRCLDVGCDDGAFAEIIRVCADTNVSHGVDVNEFAVQKGALLYPKVFIQHYNGSNLPYSNDVFDVVTCVNSLGHMLYPFLALQDMFRVLKIGGVLGLHLPNLTYYDDIGDHNGDLTQRTCWTMQETIEKVKKAGFQIDSVEGIGRCYEPTGSRARITLKGRKP